MTPDEQFRAAAHAQITGFGCPDCGAINVTTTRKLHAMRYGANEGAKILHVMVPERTCHSCEFIFWDYEAEWLLGAAVRAHLSPATTGSTPPPCVGCGESDCVCDD